MNTISEKELAKEFREKYIKNPLESMSDNDLFDMDYFLHKEDLFDEDTGVESFYIF